MNKALKIIGSVLFVAAVPAIFITAYFLGKEDREMEEEREVYNYSPEITIEQKMNEETEAVKIIDLPSEKDKEEAAQIASSFILAFHEVDANDQFKYVENARPFMSQRMYEEYQNIPRRGTLEAANVVPVGTDILPTSLEKNNQLWRVVVTSEKESVAGEKRLVFNEYNVLLIKDGRRWIVDGVVMNGAEGE